jgi:hypothetical protein
MAAGELPRNAPNCLLNPPASARRWRSQPHAKKPRPATRGVDDLGIGASTALARPAAGFLSCA